MHPPPTVGTEYHGPVMVTAFEFGGRAIRLVRPADPDRLLDDSVVLDWNRRDDYMPYWAYLWPAAYLLAEAVAREPWPEPESADEALEIGCGLGLAGLVGLARGLRVQFSDYDPAPLDFVARSAAENGFDATRFTTRLLDWRNLPDERFPVILGADVIYEARLVPLVAERARQAARPRRRRPDRQPVPRRRRGVPGGCRVRGTGLPGRACDGSGPRTADRSRERSTASRRPGAFSRPIRPQRADDRAEVGQRRLSSRRAVRSSSRRSEAVGS